MVWRRWPNYWPFSLTPPTTGWFPSQRPVTLTGNECLAVNLQKQTFQHKVEFLMVWHVLAGMWRHCDDWNQFILLLVVMPMLCVISERQILVIKGNYWNFITIWFPEWFRIHVWHFYPNYSTIMRGNNKNDTDLISFGVKVQIPSSFTYLISIA